MGKLLARMHLRMQIPLAISHLDVASTPKLHPRQDSKFISGGGGGGQLVFRSGVLPYAN